MHEKLHTELSAYQNLDYLGRLRSTGRIIRVEDHNSFFGATRVEAGGVSHTDGDRKQIVAIIEQVQIWVDGWYVTSVWTDALTGRSYRFHSHLIDCGLEPVVGECVIVNVEDCFSRAK